MWENVFFFTYYIAMKNSWLYNDSNIYYLLKNSTSC